MFWINSFVNSSSPDEEPDGALPLSELALLLLREAGGTGGGLLLLNEELTDEG